MITIITDNNLFKKDLEKQLNKLKARYEFINNSPIARLKTIYTQEPQTHCLIASSTSKFLPQNMWLDLLESISKWLPVLLLAEDKQILDIQKHNPNLISLQKTLDVEAVINFIDSCGAIKGSLISEKSTKIPLLNIMVAEELLKKNGYLSVISIHASNFDKISLEYGAEIFSKLNNILENILVEIRGTSGAFRSQDILCRRSFHSSTFYILLDRKRANHKMPTPGELEKLSDRLSNSLELLLWGKLQSPSSQLPGFFHIVPRFVVGYSSNIYNFCLDSRTQIETLFRSCRQTANIQEQRLFMREKELVQSIINSENMLTTHYQGIFDLKKIDDSQFSKLKFNNAIQVIPQSILGYEALTRIDKHEFIKQLDSKFHGLVNHLNPYMLFSKASTVKLKLELDQACFKKAFENYIQLKGLLFVNILPRNIYHIEELKHEIPESITPVFEISESEAINNMKLIQEIREQMRNSRFQIAIDDFGSGYAGIERIIELQPNIVKLDICLIKDINKNKKMEAFVKGLLEAATSTKSIILAEGVETIGELKKLKEIGVDLVQGFFLHKPELRSNIQKKLK